MTDPLDTMHQVSSSKDKVVSDDASKYQNVKITKICRYLHLDSTLLAFRLSSGGSSR